MRHRGGYVSGDKPVGPTKAPPGPAPGAQRVVPDHIYKVWGDMAVLCPDHKEGPTWHHRTYHEPTPPHSWRIRWLLVRKSLSRELRYLLRGR